MIGQIAEQVAKRRVAMWIAAACCCLLLAGCGAPQGTPEEAVRAWVDEGVARAKEKDRRGLMRMISPDYADARGNNRDAIEDLFRLYFLRAGDIALLTRIESLEIYGDTAAELLMTVGMAGRSDGVLGFSADAYRFEMELERDGDDWILIGARWGELGEELR